MEPCVYYSFHSKRVLVTHEGFSGLTENLIFVGVEQMINGAGKPDDAGIIAANFNRNTKEDTYQVHAHRNPENLPIFIGRTFNLSYGAEKKRSLGFLHLKKMDSIVRN